LIPSISVVSYLLNPSHPRFKIEPTAGLSTARALGIELRVINASSETELDLSFTSLKHGVDVLIVAADPFFDSQRERIVALATTPCAPRGPRPDLRGPR